MRRILLALVAPLAVYACSGVEDTAAPPSELVDFEPAVRLVELWSAGTGASTEKWIRLVPVADGETLYAAGFDGRVAAYALDEEGGRRWRVDLDTTLSAGLGSGGDSLYVGTAEGTLIALSADDGSERWRRDLGGELLAPPAADADRVVARTADGRIVALDAAGGERQWTFSTDVPDLSLRGNGDPILVSGAVLAGLDDGNLLALDASEGSALWRTTIAEPSGRSPVERMVDVDGRIGLVGGAIYAAAYQGRVARVSPQRGRIDWNANLSSYAGVAVDGDTAYVTTEDDHVVAMGLETGEIAWRQEKMAHRRLTAPVRIEGTQLLALGDLEGYVHILTRADGRIVAREGVGGDRILADPLALGDGRFAVQTQGGDLALLEIRALD